VYDRAVEEAIIAARRSVGPGGSPVRVTWVGARLEADRRALAAQGRLVVTVSYVRN
jgi:hypothetical protein